MAAASRPLFLLPPLLLILTLASRLLRWLPKFAKRGRHKQLPLQRAKLHDMEGAMDQHQQNISSFLPCRLFTPSHLPFHIPSLFPFFITTMLS